MRIVNPGFGLAASGGEQLVGQAVDWGKDPIVLFSNGKANARELLEGIRDRLGEFRPTDNIAYVNKNDVSHPAPPALMDEVVKSYRGALLAIGD